MRTKIYMNLSQLSPWEIEIEHKLLNEVPYNDFKVFSLWASELSENVFLLTLPLIGAIICLFLIFPARLFAKLHKHNSAQTGSYLMSSIFSNIGYSWGGFLCLFFSGREGACSIYGIQPL